MTAKQSLPCWIYKGHRQQEMYLYMDKEDDFSAVPELLMEKFGQPSLVMNIDLMQRAKLARVDIKQVRQSLVDQGFFLQMPPEIEVELNQAEY